LHQNVGKAKIGVLLPKEKPKTKKRLTGLWQKSKKRHVCSNAFGGGQSGVKREWGEKKEFAVRNRMHTPYGAVLEREKGCAASESEKGGRLGLKENRQKKRERSILLGEP